jgi:hypothetical protein
MRKSLTCAIALLSVLVLLSTSLTSSIAAIYTKIGVKAGDKADYSFTSKDPRIDGSVAHVSIQKVEGTVVTINGTIRYPNGTIQVEFINGDVSSGEDSVYYFLICANLTGGDPIYSGSRMKVTETISMNIVGASRDVNHMNSGNLLMSFDVYWDKLSGLMVKLDASGFGFWITVTLTNTTAWSRSVQPPAGINNTGGTGSSTGMTSGVEVWVLVGGVAAVAVIAATVVLRRRGK